LLDMNLFWFFRFYFFLSKRIFSVVTQKKILFLPSESDKTPDQIYKKVLWPRG
jgi:hypothetical protein